MIVRALELKVPPLVLVLAVGTAMWLLAAAVPSFHVALPWHRAVAAVLVIAGAIVTFAGVVAFRRAGTTVNPMAPASASALVRTGIYRVTRNPMYLGFLLVLLGWAATLSNALAAVAVPLFVWYMNRFQISPEERALAALFGAEYVAYRQAVRRWL